MDVTSVKLEGTVTPKGTEFTFIDMRVRVEGDWVAAMAIVGAIRDLELSDGEMGGTEVEADEAESEAPKKATRRRGKVTVSSDDADSKPVRGRRKKAEPAPEEDDDSAGGDEDGEDEAPAPRRPRRRGKSTPVVEEVETEEEEEEEEAPAPKRARGRRKASDPTKEDVAKAASSGAEELSAEAMGEIIAEYSDSHKIDDIPEENRKAFIEAVEYELADD